MRSCLLQIAPYETCLSGQLSYKMASQEETCLPWSTSNQVVSDAGSPP